MAESVFPGSELGRVLESVTVASPGLMLTGMVRASGQNGNIEFTNSGCNAWMTIPTNIIEQAEHLGYGTCKEQAHPVFRLSLASPKDPEAQVLAALLRNAQQQAANSEMSQMVAGMRMAGAPYPQGPESVPGASAAMRISTGGIGGIGGDVLGAWGCWDSTCTECILSERVCNGTACWTICKIWIEKPCERCIWPW